MKPNLEPAKTVLRSFLSEIEIVKGFQPGFSSPTQTDTSGINGMEFGSELYWQKEEAYSWLYGEAWFFRSLMHRAKTNVVPNYFHQPALPVYQQWRSEEKEIFSRSTHIIPTPDTVSLGKYLHLLSSWIVDKNEKRTNWIKSLHCFLQFLREDTDLDQQGAIEVIFPYKMEIRPGYSFQHSEKGIQKVERPSILRRVYNSAYPIDILAASDILKNLAKTIFEGRPNAQQKAAETLGFALLCHAVGAYRVTTREEIVFTTPLTALKSPDPAQPKEYFKPEYFIGIKSLYGVVEVPISKTLHDFLITLPRDPKNECIFNTNLESLHRTFQNKGVKPSKRTQGLGKITFLTFMSQPHEAIGHRHSPMKKPRKSKKKSKLLPTK